MKQEWLTGMADLLNADSFNYSVFLRAYAGTMQDSSAVGEILGQLLGEEVVVDGVHDTDISEVMQEVGQCLAYAGDESFGPGTSTLNSPAFATLLKSVLEDIAKLGEASYGLKSFEFIEGHPAYPVFWDFAYLFLGREEHVLLVGSSSD